MRLEHVRGDVYTRDRRGAEGEAYSTVQLYGSYGRASGLHRIDSHAYRVSWSVREGG